MTAVVSLRGDPITAPGEVDPKALEVARDALARVESGECNGVVIVLSYADGATGHLIGGSRVSGDRMLGALARAMHNMNQDMNHL